MINFFRLFISFIFILLSVSCSFKNPGGFFNDRLAELEKEISLKNSKLVFAKRKNFREEIFGNTKAEISTPIVNQNWTQRNLTSSNYIPHLEYKNEKKILFKSKKLGRNKFKLSNIYTEPVLFENNIFFYDTSGTIFNFSISQRKLVWKFNFYKNRYKKIPININLKISNNNLIASDNLGYFYSLNIDKVELNWAKNYGIPFRSNIKIDDKSIFVLNQDNKYYVVREDNGEQNVSLETFPSFLKSKQETNITLDVQKNNIYFVTSNGEFYSINYTTNNINWLSSLFFGGKGKGSDLFFSSPIIYKDGKIFFSSSVSSYSMNSNNGTKNWELPFSTDLRPIISKNFVFLSSKDGFLVSLGINDGKVIWSKDIFKNNKKLKSNKIGNIKSLLLVSNQLLAVTSKGFFIFFDYRDGKILGYTRVTRSGFFSNPIVVNKKIYVIDNNMRVLVIN